MAETREAFVGFDVAKLRNAVAVADAGRDGEVRFHGEVDASAESMRRLAAKLAGKHERLHFCYEAGPTGYAETPPCHPCTAPKVRPRTRWRWTSMPSTIEGTSEVTASALASPYWAPWKPRKARNTVGSV